MLAPLLFTATVSVLLGLFPDTLMTLVKAVLP